MPATQGGGSRKILAVVGASISLGVVAGIIFVFAAGGGAHARSEHATHKDLDHRAKGQRPHPQPAEEVHLVTEHHKEERHEQAQGEEVYRRRNSTNETDHGANITNTTHHGQEHLQCNGGPLAACQCMLRCRIFGGNTSHCSGHSHNETKDLVDGLILKTMLSHRNMCEGMRCIKNCAKELGCLDEKVQEDCRLIELNYAANRMKNDPECHLHCSS
mmetsp:Transcript_58669/g.182241  ORF Transcript_58669/g.182241 Transcript_58669/m.182241 type:complete len:216 (-) Transcript_58669:245-892(-)